MLRSLTTSDWVFPDNTYSLLPALTEMTDPSWLWCLKTAPHVLSLTTTALASSRSKAMLGFIWDAIFDLKRKNRLDRTEIQLKDDSLLFSMNQVFIYKWLRKWWCKKLAKRNVAIGWFEFGACKSARKFETNCIVQEYTFCARRARFYVFVCELTLHLNWKQR